MGSHARSKQGASEREREMNDVLMLLPVTGKVGGKRKSTVVTMT